MLLDNTSAVFSALVPAVALTLLLNAFLPKLRLQWRLRHIPIANKKPGEWSDQKATARAQTYAMDIMNEALVKVRFSSRLLFQTSKGLTRTW